MSTESPPRAAAHPIEYQIIEMPVGSIADKQAFLNEQGQDGWELVELAGLTVGGTHYVVFMRLV
jgi:hypothetical protein